MYKYLFFVLLFMLSFPASQAQNQNNSSHHAQNSNNIYIYKDYRLDTLINRTLAENEEKQCIQGYRIQIFFGTSREKANEIKSLFLQNYPDEKIYLIYRQPYFKIHIGDFRNRIEAQKMYYALIENEEFRKEGVFLVPDTIFLPDL
jgi:hypothetical protein